MIKAALRAFGAWLLDVTSETKATLPTPASTPVSNPVFVQSSPEINVLTELVANNNPQPLLQALLANQVVFKKRNNWHATSLTRRIQIEDDIYFYLEIDGRPISDFRFDPDPGTDRLTKDRITCAAARSAFGPGRVKSGTELLVPGLNLNTEASRSVSKGGSDA